MSALKTGQQEKVTESLRIYSPVTGKRANEERREQRDRADQAHPRSGKEPQLLFYACLSPICLSPHGICAPSHVTAVFPIQGEENVSPHPDWGFTPGACFAQENEEGMMVCRFPGWASRILARCHLFFHPSAIVVSRTCLARPLSQDENERCVDPNHFGQATADPQIREHK